MNFPLLRFPKYNDFVNDDSENNFLYICPLNEGWNKFKLLFQFRKLCNSSGNGVSTYTSEEEINCLITRNKPFFFFLSARWCVESKACSFLCWKLWEMGGWPDTTLSLQLPLLHRCHHPALACQNSEYKPSFTTSTVIVVLHSKIPELVKYVNKDEVKPGLQAAFFSFFFFFFF